MRSGANEKQTARKSIRPEGAPPPTRPSEARPKAVVLPPKVDAVERIAAGAAKNKENEVLSVASAQASAAAATASGANAVQVGTVPSQPFFRRPNGGTPSIVCLSSDDESGNDRRHKKSKGKKKLSAKVGSASFLLILCR